MRPLIVLVLIASCLAAGACAPSAGAGPEAAEWGVDRLGHLCRAMRVTDADVVAIDLSREPGASAITINADALRSVGAIAQDTLYPGIVLTVDGEPVRAVASGSLTGRGLPGFAFPFNARQLVRRHPDGFALAIVRNGATLYRADLRDTAPIFRQLAECDRGLLLNRSGS
jgi:hypothetical protein